MFSWRRNDHDWFDQATNQKKEEVGDDADMTVIVTNCIIYVRNICCISWGRAVWKIINDIKWKLIIFPKCIPFAPMQFVIYQRSTRHDRFRSEEKFRCMKHHFI